MTDKRHPVASRQHRLGGRAVDLAMYSVTFGIGWLIWSLVVWGQGQTPGKQIVKLRVYDKTTGKPAKWGHMAIREFLLPLSVIFILAIPAAVLSAIPNTAVRVISILLIYVGVIAAHLTDALWIFKGEARNRLVDVICKTDVVNEADLI